MYKSTYLFNTFNISKIDAESNDKMEQTFSFILIFSEYTPMFSSLVLIVHSISCYTNFIQINKNILPFPKYFSPPNTAEFTRVAIPALKFLRRRVFIKTYPELPFISVCTLSHVLPLQPQRNSHHFSRLCLSGFYFNRASICINPCAELFQNQPPLSRRSQQSDFEKRAKKNCVGFHRELTCRA